MAQTHRRKYAGAFLLLMLMLQIGLASSAGTARAADSSRYFPETGFTVSGKFLDYWNARGGLQVFGYPITAAQNEVDPETGNTYLIQWFERNRFELHPENAGTPYEVLLGLLGKDLRREALTIDPDFVLADPLNDPSFRSDEQIYFTETGHNLRDRFLRYWRDNGGLERFGYPISEMHRELEPETGQVFDTQWFERARFEYHPENRGTPYEILLGLLGKQIKSPATFADYAWKLGQPNFKTISSARGVSTDQYGNVYVVDGISAVRKYATNGSFLAHWENGLNNNRFYQPSNVAIDGFGNIYVADKENQLIQKLDRTGGFIQSWGGSGYGPGQTSRPEGVAIDSRGNVYVADTGNQRVQKFTNDGQFLTEWRGPQDNELGSCYGIAIDAADNVYVAATTKRQIHKYSAGGQFLASWGSSGSGDGQFLDPFGVAVDAQGFVYVADTYNHRIQKFTSSGQFVTKWGNGKGAAEGQFNDPYGVAVDRNGTVYVADRGNGRVQKFDTNGRYLGLFTNTSPVNSSYKSPFGVATNKQGEIYVADTQNARIVKLSASGQTLLSWGSRGTQPGQFSSPTSIVVDSQGNVFVADPLIKTVQKFTANGQFLTRWRGSPIANGDFGYLSGIATDRQDNIYVVESDKKRVQKFDNQGNFIATWGTPGTGDGQFVYPQGIAVDSVGRVYVSDSSPSRIQIFDSNGTTYLGKVGNGRLTISSYALAFDADDNLFLTDAPYSGFLIKLRLDGQVLGLWSGQGSADGQFGAVTAIALDGRGGVYIADYINDRIQKFKLR